MKRRISFKNANNVRDLGGLKTESGKTLKGGFVQYTEQQGDQLYLERAYFFFTEDKVVLVNFLTFGANMASELTVPALYDGISYSK